MLDYSQQNAKLVMEQVLFKELDSIIQLLEEQSIPANPAGKKANRLEEQLTADVEKYFKQMELSIPQEDLERLYYRYVEQD